MTRVDPERLIGLIREICRTLIVTMNDVAALKILALEDRENGRERLDRALQAAEKATKPLLDRVDQAGDQELLDLIAGWTERKSI
jgi:hypothetical protein